MPAATEPWLIRLDTEIHQLLEELLTDRPGRKGMIAFKPAYRDQWVLDVGRDREVRAHRKIVEVRHGKFSGEARSYFFCGASARSEERRVGKDRRSRWSPYH